MDETKIKNAYLDLGYKLTRLFGARSKVWSELSNYEFDEKISNRKSQTVSVKKMKKTITDLNLRIKRVERHMEELNKQATSLKIELPFENLASKYNLSKDEKYIIMTIFYYENWAMHHEPSGKELVSIFGYKPSVFIEKSPLLSKLIKNEIIEINNNYLPSPSILLEVSYCLTAKTLQSLIGNDTFVIDERNEKCDGGFLYRPNQEHILKIREPIIGFDQIVLDDSKKQELDKVIAEIKNSSGLFRQWGFEQTIKYGRGMTILFYGAPGTGKTVTSEALARCLDKRISVVNYSKILSPWVGHSEKHIVKVFEEASENECVLVFDEADALFGQRLYEFHSIDRLNNYMTNILMQELERFEGICILTTNREVAMDAAFSRRILLKLKFDSPGPEERAKIWRMLIPPQAPLAKNVDFQELGNRFKLTGGEIKNVLINVVRECNFRNEPEITMTHLTEYAKRELTFTTKINKEKVGFLS